MARCLGVVAAGGRGARLALGVPKALVKVGGTTLLARVLDTLHTVCDRVVVTAPAGMALPIDRAARIDDPPDAQGPLAGVVAGLGAEPFDRALVLGVDFPLIETGFLRALIDRLEGHAAVLPAPHGVPQPLAAAYAPSAAVALAGALRAGERSMTLAAWRLEPRLVDDAELEEIAGGFENLLNLNTPADLARAEMLLGLRARSGSAA